MQYDRQIIDAVAARQIEACLGAVVDDDHPGETYVKLPDGVVVRVGMEPGGRGRLVDLDHRPPAAPGLDDLVRPAVDVAGGVAVPVV